MKTAMLLALGLLLVGGWPQDGAIAQTVPPVSLAPPKASPPRAGTRKPPAAAPTVSGPAQAPNPALDHDGFSVGGENDAQTALTAGTRGVRNRGADSSSLDPDDEALKRKLIICQNCK
jgi:hypothetical protein